MGVELKDRFYTLDAMRGIAAMAVFMGHAEIFFGTLASQHSGLAVDLFFVLSGFVLTEAYGCSLLVSGAVWPFFKKRVIRLYPLYFIGLIIAVASDAAALLAGKGDFSISGFLIAIAAGLLMLPSPTWFNVQQIMPLNPPSWSLLFELVVNIIFSVLYRYLNTIFISIIMAISLMWLAASVWFTGEFIGGFYWSNITVGLPRVCFSFFAGVLIYRHLPSFRIKTNWVWLPVAVLVPLLYLPRSSVWFDLFIVATALPALVVIGAIMQPMQGNTFEFIGCISYPLYIIHVPVIFVVYRLFNLMHRPFMWMAPFTGGILLFAICAISIVLNKYYDGPARFWLTELLREKAKTDRPDRKKIGDRIG